MSDEESSSKKNDVDPSILPSRIPTRTGRLGKEIYERDIRHLVIDDHVGEIVAIDIDTGKWALDADMLRASDLLREQCPDAKDVWILRVGYRAVGSIGGGAPPRDQ